MFLPAQSYGLGYDYDSSFLSSGGCLIGTDCSDCSPLSLCEAGDCSNACRERGLRLGANSYCLSTYLNDGLCNAQCNNFECGHDLGDCSFGEIFEQCRLGHGVGWAHIKSVPGNRSSTQLTLGSNRTTATAAMQVHFVDFKPITFTLNSDTAVWSIGIESSVTMRWSDSRLNTVACRDILPDLLSLKHGETTTQIREQKEEYKALVWFPRIAISGNSIDYHVDSLTRSKTIGISSFRFDAGDAGVAWDASSEARAGLGLGETCYDCASYNYTMKTSIDISPSFNYRFFPFDEQTFVFTVTIGQADIFNCASMLPQDNIQSLLPTTGEWRAQNLTTGHTVINGVIQLGSCEVAIVARRNFLMCVDTMNEPSAAHHR